MRGAALAAGALLLAGGALAQPETPEASGGLAWCFSDDLDLVGAMRVRVPLPPLAGWTPFADLDAVTAIEKSVGNFTFDVRDLPYGVRLGARRGAWTVFTGVRGVEGVDADGSARVTLAGAAWAAEFPSGEGRRASLEVRLALAAALDARGVEADGAASVDARLGVPRGGVVWALDLRLDALVEGLDAKSDLEGGPRCTFRLGDGRRFSLFAHALRSRHPLGLRASGVLVGFEASEGSGPRGAPRRSPPDLRGEVAAGVGGDARRSGRLRLALLSPPWGSGWRGILDVDANVLTAADTGELYYLYDAGVERAGERLTWGGYFYHRSNHVLAEPNPTGVTSRNVVEGGVETRGWSAPPRPRAVDARARAGALVDSSFGESRGWNLRAGVRLAGPAWGGAVPWLALDLEEGDASARRAAAGVSFAGGWEVRADWRREEQFFGSDKSAFTAGVAATF